jgi:hypothetical protein
MPDDLSVLSDRIQHPFSLAFSDTAVREACVGREHRIKVALDRERWGDSLVNQLLPRLRASGMLAESHLRILRGEIRTVVKSSRNDFTPNFIDIDGIQGRALLHRIARVQVELDRVL